MLSNCGIFNVVTNLRKKISRLYLNLVTNKLYKEKRSISEREAYVFSTRSKISSRLVSSLLLFEYVALSVVGVSDVLHSTRFFERFVVNNSNAYTHFISLLIRYSVTSIISTLRIYWKTAGNFAIRFFRQVYGCVHTVISWYTCSHYRSCQHQPAAALKALSTTRLFRHAIAGEFLESRVLIY